MSDEAAAKKRIILQARAQALARPPTPQEAPGERLQVAEFALANERYAFVTTQIHEVCPLKDFTPVPCVPPFVLGVINVRGQIVTVADLRVFFELPVTAPSEQSRVIIIEHENLRLGILADAVTGARSVSLAELLPGLPTLTGVRAEFLRGVAPDRLAVLDAEKLLRDARIQVREEVEN